MSKRKIQKWKFSAHLKDTRTYQSKVRKTKQHARVPSQRPRDIKGWWQINYNLYIVLFKEESIHATPRSRFTSPQLSSVHKFY